MTATPEHEDVGQDTAEAGAGRDEPQAMLERDSGKEPLDTAPGPPRNGKENS